MAPITKLAILALERQGGPKTVLAAVPGGIRAAATAARVSPGRISQVLRQKALPYKWATLFAELIGCSPWDVYHQLGQQPLSSALGPLFDLRASFEAAEESSCE